jgi:ATP-dependent DNA helicase DinG
VTRPDDAAGFGGPGEMEAGGLVQALEAAFSLVGPLSLSDPRFSVRSAQLAMARAVAQAVDAQDCLVVEAGTGVGKTFAYLVPVLLSGRRALVSTATKSLQDQLYLRDLPRLRSVLQMPVHLALLKGRASYLCLHRLGVARQAVDGHDRWAARALARVEAWALHTRSGDIAEVQGLDERSPVLPLVTSTRENCLGSDCPQWSACHVVRARREAMAADIVVVNHHLFFADIALRETEVAELLPTVDVAVFDEAHQLMEVGLQFLGTGLGSGQILDLARDLLAAGLRHARGLRAWQDIAAQLESGVRELRLAAAGGRVDVRAAVKVDWEAAAAHPGWSEALGAVQDHLEQAHEAAMVVEGTAPDWKRLVQRCAELAARAQRFREPADATRVRWVDLTPHGVRLAESPLDIRDALTAQRQSARRSWIFTSATLGSDERLSWFTAGTGLEDAHILKVGSPFDYPRQARLWVPQDMPLPQDSGHSAAVGRLAARCAAVLSGRTFVLTTTLKALALVAQAIRSASQSLPQPLEVLVQGEEPRRSLLQRFGDGAGKLLVGSQSFWEGIDVPGEALQCVLIDKLPFPPPNDPLVKARSQAIELRGGSAFEDYFLAEAAVSLKQGAGRLIRTEHDRGLLVVCDPRMGRMGYGKTLYQALPPMTRLETEAQALAWLEEVAAANLAG